MRKKLLIRQIRWVCAAMAASGLLFYGEPTAEAAGSVLVTEDGAAAENHGVIRADTMYSFTPNPDSGAQFCFNGMGIVKKPNQLDAKNVVLTNHGTIYVNMQQALDRIIAGYQPTDTVMARGMLGGENANLTNNGAIYMIMDEQSGNDWSLFAHAMYVGKDSTATNNGVITLRGNGSPGANVRGMTSSASNLVLTNNGVIDIHADDSFMARALATIGENGVLSNNGVIRVVGNNTVWGMSQSGATHTINNGLIDVTSDNTLPNQGAAIIKTLFEGGPVAYGMAVSGLTKQTPSYLGNTGVIYARGNSGYNAYGMYVANLSTMQNESFEARVDVDNTGIVAVTNGYEFGVNTSLDVFKKMGNTIQDTSYNNGRVKINSWATTLRDFKENLFVARNCTLDFTNARFILRPDGNWGTAYGVSEDVMINKSFKLEWLDKSVEAGSGGVTVEGFDTIDFVSEMPEFITVNLSDDHHKASLTPSRNAGAAQRMMATAALSGVDFARSNLRSMDDLLGGRIAPEAPSGAWDTFIASHYSELTRDGGMDLKTRGFLGGADRALSDKLRVGWHAGYAWNSGSDGFYGGDMSGKAAVLGLHSVYYPAANSYLRGRISGYFASGDARYAAPGTSLVGRSDSGADGVYGSVFLGREYRLGATDSFRAEIGLTALHLSMNPDVRWNIGGAVQDHYSMHIDDEYNAVYAEAMTRWTSDRTAPDGSGRRASFGIGLRGKLTASDLSMKFDGIAFPGTVAEEDVTALAQLNYTWRKNNDQEIGLSYTGEFGGDLKSHGIRVNFTQKF